MNFLIGILFTLSLTWFAPLGAAMEGTSSDSKQLGSSVTVGDIKKVLDNVSGEIFRRMGKKFSFEYSKHVRVINNDPIVEQNCSDIELFRHSIKVAFMFTEKRVPDKFRHEFHSSIKEEFKRCIKAMENKFSNILMELDIEGRNLIRKFKKIRLKQSERRKVMKLPELLTDNEIVWIDISEFLYQKYGVQVFDGENVSEDAWNHLVMLWRAICLGLDPFLKYYELVHQLKPSWAEELTSDQFIYWTENNWMGDLCKLDLRGPSNYSYLYHALRARNEHCEHICPPDTFIDTDEVLNRLKAGFGDPNDTDRATQYFRVERKALVKYSEFDPTRCDEASFDAHIEAMEAYGSNHSLFNLLGSGYVMQIQQCQEKLFLEGPVIDENSQKIVRLLVMNNNIGLVFDSMLKKVLWTPHVQHLKDILAESIVSAQELGLGNGTGIEFEKLMDKLCGRVSMYETYVNYVTLLAKRQEKYLEIPDNQFFWISAHRICEAIMQMRKTDWAQVEKKVTDTRMKRAFSVAFKSN